MKINIELGKNFKIPDKVMSEFVERVKRGDCVGTIDHTEPTIRLIDSRYVVNEIYKNEDNTIVGDITPIEGTIFKQMIEKSPNYFRFFPTGYCHKEINEETGEEVTVIDSIISINATQNKIIDVNLFLETLYDLHESLASISSTKSKIDILTRFKNSDVYIDGMLYYNKILNYIYDGDITFGITSEKVDDFSKDAVGNIYSEFMTLLDDLSERRLTGDTALATTKKFVDMLNRDYGEKSVKMFKMILDKDFKCGVNVKTMAKVFPVKLPFTEYVALANKYFDREDKVNFDNETWMWSRKLDGNRLILIKNKSGVRCFSRQGKEIKTLDVLRNIIGKVDGDFVLDGEVCIIDNEGNENFQEIMKVITKKNYTIEHPVMKVFDILSEDEFFGRKKSDRFCMRYERLKLFFEKNNTMTDNFNLV